MLRLNVPVAFGTRQIAPLLSEFARRHPLVTVELGLNDRLVDLADEGWDLGDPHRQSQQFKSDRAADRALPHRRLRGAVLSRSTWQAAHGFELGRAQLPWLHALKRDRRRSMGVRRKGRRHRLTLSGNLRANNGEALRTAAIAGQGLAYLPTFIVADDMRAGTLVALDLDQPTVEFGGIYAVFLPDRHPAAKVRAFIDFIANRFAPEPPWDKKLET